ncbi:MAG: hypothetical protein ACYCVX_12080 [Thiobacillus sp.]
MSGEEGLPLGMYAERCYLAYAMSVVKGRALPYVEDGMKPVQRPAPSTSSLPAWWAT